MVIDRRQLLGAMLAALSASRAAAAAPPPERLFVSCRMDGENNASVACFDRQGREVFAASLPARGHDITLRPGGGEIVVFARRPGNWFVSLARDTGAVLNVVHAAAGRHFYGHGVFAPDARLLYATENDIASGGGVIGIYDATDGYRRVGEFASGGIGPHDLALLPGGHSMVIANGGLRTHPDTGREVLNPLDMRPNLVLLDLQSGQVMARHELGDSLRQLSIRHLAVRADGLIAFGCQYQGNPEDAPQLLGVLNPGGEARMLEVAEEPLYRMQNYIGSVAFDDGGDYLIGTSPQGGTALVWDMAQGRLLRSVAMSDVCGAAPLGSGAFLMTSGNAGISELYVSAASAVPHASRWIWDNHACSLVPA